MSELPARIDGPPMDETGMVLPADYPAHGNPSKIAIIWEEHTTTYAALDRAASAFVALLRGFGIAPGERIVYLGKNNDLYFAVVFGALRAGVVIVPLNWRCTVPELSYIIGDCAPRLVIHDAEFQATAQASANGAALLPVEGAGGLRENLAATQPGTPGPATPDTPAMLMYTSGTTGKPKGVVITQRMVALARHAEMISPDYSTWEPTDILLSPMPNFHMGGLSWLLGGFRRGLTCVITADTTPKGLLALLAAHSISRVFIVPTVVRAILEEMRLQEITLPALKEVQYGAAPMDEALLSASMRQIGCGFLQHYGMTEVTGSATRLGPADHDVLRPHLLRSVGKPQPGLCVEIRRADKTLAARGEAGEIWIKSVTLMPGYWKLPEATAGAIEDGWYRSGDGGLLDPEGFLFLTDRIKDMVVSGGENIYPVEVEAALRLHPAVMDAAVFGVADPRWGEVVCAAVEFRPGQTADEDTLRAHARTQLAGYKVPKKFYLSVVLPRTATGKIQRREAKTRFATT